jgi:hypothetical protein
MDAEPAPRLPSSGEENPLVDDAIETYEESIGKGRQRMRLRAVLREEFCPANEMAINTHASTTLVWARFRPLEVEQIGSGNSLKIREKYPRPRVET